MALETGLWHSHPFTKSHFPFLIAVESAISRVLLQQSKKNEGSSAQGQDSGRMVFPSERTVTAVVSEVRSVFALSYSMITRCDEVQVSSCLT
jgi:hypothetical protein